MNRVHQVILNILVTKYLSNKVFDYIDIWSETLESVSWVIRASYHCTIQAKPSQSLFGREMIFNLASDVDWWVITVAKQRQVKIDNAQENDRQVTHAYAICNQDYAEMTGIYCKLDYIKQGLYCCISGHQWVRCVWIMRSWNSNLVHLPICT